MGIGAQGRLRKLLRTAFKQPTGGFVSSKPLLLFCSESDILGLAKAVACREISTWFAFADWDVEDRSTAFDNTSNGEEYQHRSALEENGMFSFLIGLVGSVIALVGWFGFKSVILLIVGTALYVIETAIEWHELNVNSKKLDIVIFIIGCAVAAIFTSAPWYVGGMIAIAIYSLIMGVFGLASILKFFFKILN